LNPDGVTKPSKQSFGGFFIWGVASLPTKASK